MSATSVYGDENIFYKSRVDITTCKRKVHCLFKSREKNYPFESSSKVVLSQIEKGVFGQQIVIEVSFKPFARRSETDEATGTPSW